MTTNHSFDREHRNEKTFSGCQFLHVPNGISLGYWVNPTILGVNKRLNEASTLELYEDSLFVDLHCRCWFDEVECWGLAQLPRS